MDLSHLCPLYREFYTKPETVVTDPLVVIALIPQVPRLYSVVGLYLSSFFIPSFTENHLLTQVSLLIFHRDPVFTLIVGPKEVAIVTVNWLSCRLRQMNYGQFIFKS